MYKIIYYLNQRKSWIFFNQTLKSSNMELLKVDGGEPFVNDDIYRAETQISKPLGQIYLE